jgi:Flagellar biosynthesis protein, FliO
VIAEAAARVGASPRGRAAMLAAALCAAGVLALSPGALAPAAARAALGAAAIAALAVVARRRSVAAAATAPAALAVIAREPLAGGTGLALVQAGSRHLVVGFGRDGVRLVADLGPAREEAP